jgi:SagB-type dehydrogenase family enzyme
MPARRDEDLTRRAVARAHAPAPRRGAGSRVRRARTLVLVLEAGGLTMLNFLSHACEPCPALAQRLLTAAESWLDPAALVASTPARARRAAAAEVARLIASGWLVVDGTEAARHDATFEERFEWDIRAGLFHLGIKDPPTMTMAEQVEDLEARIRERPRPSLYTTNRGRRKVVRLPPPDLDSGCFALLGRRQTFRSFAPTPVPLMALRDCLVAGLGIVELCPEPLPGMGPMPRKMTPSGGALNPYEAYVLVTRVEGLPAGFYHYSAVDGTLGLVAAPPLPRPSDLLCEQAWSDGAGAAIFLVANFARSMWKYGHPMVYRTVLIEAGHIGQNVMLAATHHGLCAAPSDFPRDRRLEELLGLDRVMQSVVYALMLGEPVRG